MSHRVRREFRNEYVLGEAVSDHAEGAEGRVYFCRKKLAEGQISAESYAVKVFTSKDSGAHMKMKKQVTAMEATGHVNILKTYDHFDEEDDGTFYVVMELASGGELFDQCVNVNGNGAMPERGLQLVARQLLRGLAHAHLRGILHLDLKMENILLKNRVTREDWASALDTPDAPIQLKIMDYGFCEFNIGGDDNVKWLGQTAPGTEGYRAPEVVLQLRQVSGAKITVASDLFSFGCVLYMMSCGYPAFRCSRDSCRRSNQGCTCKAISNKLIALSEGRPEGNWIPLTDPRYKAAQGYSPLLQDLMAKLLDPNPTTRITAANALQHPWVRGQVCGPSSPSALPLSLAAEAGDARARSDSFLEEEPIRLKKAPRTHMRRFEREAFAGVSSRSSGAAACAAAVEKIKKLRMTAGGSEGDVDVLADPEHQLVDFILSDDAETCRLALISLTTQMASLQDACNFIKRLHVLQNLQQVFISFYKKVAGKMPKLLELLEVLVDHRDSRILEELLLRKELIDFIILNADSSRPSRTFLKAQRIIVRCVQTADVACDRQTVSRVLHAFSPNRLFCSFVSGFFCTRSNSDLPPTSSRRCAIFSCNDANAAKARALGFEPGRPYYIVNGTSSKLEDAHDYKFQLAAQPLGACILPPQVGAHAMDLELYLHVADPFTDQPQQRSAVRFIIELLDQADRLESDFLFVNYHQDIIVGLFESLFKAATSRGFFDDIVRSNGVQAVLNLLRRRLCPDVPLRSASTLSLEEQQKLSAQMAHSQMNASIGPWAVSTPRCEYALRFLGAVFDEAAARTTPEGCHCLSIFYPGSAVEAAASDTEPALHFHSLLDNILSICEFVAREELLGDTLKVVLEIKRRAQGYPSSQGSASKNSPPQSSAGGRAAAGGGSEGHKTGGKN